MAAVGGGNITRDVIVKLPAEEEGGDATLHYVFGRLLNGFAILS